MRRRENAIVAGFATLIVMTATASGASSRVALERSPSGNPSLQTYLSMMSWPMRQSVLHAQTLSDRTIDWIHGGDPPVLREIAQACRKLREVEARRGVLRVAAPEALNAKHRTMARAYSNARTGCKSIRSTALAVDAALERAALSGNAADQSAAAKAAARSRALFLEFRRTTVRRFLESVDSWRAATLRYAAAIGVPVPLWLKSLGR